MKSLGKRLLFYCSVNMSCVAGKYKLVVIALGSKYLSHILVGENPIVHVVAHHVRIEKIPVTHFHPDSYRFRRAVWNEMLMKFPRPMRTFRIVRPLLIDEGSRVR